MSKLPGLVEPKETSFPSGDQLGLPVAFAFMSVSLTGFVPSALQTQISSYPDLLDTKTILHPSGETTGASSSEDHDNRGFDGGLNDSFPTNSILQMSELPLALT
jgi:hypothetical protein